MKLPPASKYASRSLKLSSLFMEPIPKEAHLSPMFMPPSCRGETYSPAVAEIRRRRPSLVGGSGAGAQRDMIETKKRLRPQKIGRRCTYIQHLSHSRYALQHDDVSVRWSLDHIV